LLKAYEEYVQELEKIISRGHIDCLAHLDLVKIHGLRPHDYDPVKFFLPILQSAKKAGLAIEASTAGWRKPISEQYPHALILKAAFEMGIPIATASDAHSYAQVAENYGRLAGVLESAGVTSIVTFQAHKWNWIDL
jgi:histidinol-phosphatase (PHP family)